MANQRDIFERALISIENDREFRAALVETKSYSEKITILSSYFHEASTECLNTILGRFQPESDDELMVRQQRIIWDAVRKVGQTNNADKTLDLGCGTIPQNPFLAKELYGVDIRKTNNPNVNVGDLFVEPIPFDSSIFDFVTAHDFIEHVPRVLYTDKTIFPFVNLMSEVFRVLKVGGLFLSRTPAIPHEQAFQDPTHVNFVTRATFAKYFATRPNGKPPSAAMYGFVGNFELVSQAYNDYWLITVLKKI